MCGQENFNRAKQQGKTQQKNRGSQIFYSWKCALAKGGEAGETGDKVAREKGGDEDGEEEEEAREKEEEVEEEDEEDKDGVGDGLWVEGGENPISFYPHGITRQ